MTAVLIVEARTAKIRSGAIGPGACEPVVGAYRAETVEGRVGLEVNGLTKIKHHAPAVKCDEECFPPMTIDLHEIAWKDENDGMEA